jgi:GTPase SAR1 family protein
VRRCRVNSQLDEAARRQLDIVVVGPCAAGKTTLVNGLIARGFDGARLVVQEHSVFRNLWARRGRPDALVYLDVQAATMNRRQGRTDWTDAARAEQWLRLESAQRECDLYLPTDDLTIPQVLEAVVQFLEEHFTPGAVFPIPV